MHHRILDRTGLIAPVPAASRSGQSSLPVHTPMPGEWMADIPRLYPAHERGGQLTAERVGQLRERVRAGVYLSVGYADDTARRILASGDL